MKKAKPLILVVLLTSVFVLLYYSTFRSLFHTWTTQEDYGHGLLIIPISLYLVWMQRKELGEQPLRPDNYGIILFILWALLYLLGSIGRISTFVSISMIPLLLGVVVFVAGIPIAKIVLFPICFLVFMMPIPSEIYTMLTNPLKLIATTVSVSVLQLFDIPVLQEGNRIHLPHYSMRVVVACSGIRSLMSVIALALLMGYLMFTSNIKRVILFVFSLPVAIFGNIFRIIITGLLAYYGSSQMAEGFSHTVAGVVTFIISLAILYGGAMAIQWIGQKKE